MGGGEYLLTNSIFYSGEESALVPEFTEQVVEEGGRGSLAISAGDPY